MCSVQGFYSFFYNTIVDTVNNDPNAKEMNKKLNELDKDKFKKHFDDIKGLTPKQKSIIKILVDSKEGAEKEDYSVIIKLLYKLEEEIKKDVQF